MSGWSPADLLPGLYVLALGGLLAAGLRRWYDAVPLRVWAVFAALLAVLFGRVLFGGGVLLPLDNLRVNVPYDLLPPADAEKRCKEIVRHLRWKGPVYRISGATRQGTQELCRDVMRRLEEMAPAPVEAGE